MSKIENQILAWARKSLRFASNADAVTFAANGALFMAPIASISVPSKRVTAYQILVADSAGVVQWLNIRNVTGNFSSANLTAWLTGIVGESGIAASFTVLSSPPKMRNGHDIVHVPVIKSF